MSDSYATVPTRVDFTLLYTEISVKIYRPLTVRTVTYIVMPIVKIDISKNQLKTLTINLY